MPVPLRITKMKNGALVSPPNIYLPCLCRRNAASMIALESAEWFGLPHNFLSWTRPKHSLLESEEGVKQRDLYDNGRNTIKGGSRETKGQKRTGGGRTGYGRREIVTPLSPPPPPQTNNTQSNEHQRQK